MATIAMDKLNAMTTDDLYALNKAVVGVIRQRQTMRQVAAGSRFSVGDKAVFQDKSGRMVEVRIDKIDVKSVNCRDVKTGMPWRVAPSLLMPIAKAS